MIIIFVLLYILGFLGTILYYTDYRAVGPNITRGFILFCPGINLITAIIYLKNNDKITLKSLFEL